MRPDFDSAIDALRSCPRDRPAVALVSGRGGDPERPGSPWARHHVVAMPTGGVRGRLDESGTFHVDSWGHPPINADEAWARHGPVESLARAIEHGWSDPRESGAAFAGERGFVGGWIGWISYDLGRVIEPKGQAVGGARADRDWPLWELAWCPEPDRGRGEGQARHGALHDPERGPTRLEWAGLDERGAFESRVAEAVERVRAGEVYQVNLSHRLSAPFRGDSRALFSRLARRAQPWFGAYFESGFDAPRSAILSLSPELFLDAQLPGGAVNDEGLAVTRPMKGTLAGEFDPSELERSAKDQAELAMIVDLMRNDLGRVSALGSVRVEDPRSIERHGRDGPIWQAVASVRSRLRAGTGVADVLRAAFPPGSITGAPKVRAMRVIDELEPVRRGPYCGCIGWFDRVRGVRLSVAIRTASVTGEGPGPGEFARGTIDYSVGAGIVADSVPAREWDETLAKARPILGA